MIESLKMLTDDQLVAELARGLQLTADSLTRLGQVWAEAESRGIDLSQLRVGISKTLPLIASGRLAAEAVVVFAGRQYILDALEGLPLDRQRQLVSGKEKITIGVEDGTEVVPLKALNGNIVKVVFGDEEIRSVTQQRLYLVSQKQKKKKEPRMLTPRFNPNTGDVSIGKVKIKLADLLKVLSASTGPDRPPAADRKDDALVIRVRVTEEEFQRMQSLAKTAGLPDWEMGRKAFRAFGLI